MPAIVRLPSGKWQAQVRLPSGRRVTRSDKLRRVVVEWAREEEAKLARDEWRDPSAGRVTISEHWARWRPGRQKARKTLELYDARWRLQIEPHLGAQPIGRPRRLDIEAWVARLVELDHGPRAIGQAVSVLSAFYSAAVADRIVEHNPVRGVKGPPTALRPPEWFTRDECAAILAELDHTPAMRTLVDLDMHVGLRWGELAALRGDRVDWLRGRLHVVDVLDGGAIRPYPKTRKSFREVPIPPHVLDAMAAMMIGRPRDSLVFTAPGGGFLREPNFLRRVWQPALLRAGVDYRTPHVMRHTAASWLVQAGVSLYVVQALLGHESFATTQRYAHLAPERHDAVLGAWSTMLLGGATPLPHDLGISRIASGPHPV